MSAVTAKACTERGVAPTVYTCYDLLDLAPAGGVIDFTDGKYADGRNDRVAYLEAQHRQAEYLLDQAACSRGTRLLDIGCGYGRILQHAARRGAAPIGITISPPQAAYCNAHGLNAYVLNYRDIFRDGDTAWKGAFDSIIANGSLEHFVQVADAAAGQAEAIYADMFHIFRQVLRDGGRLVTTAIHFRRIAQMMPAELVAGPAAHPRGSEKFHFAMVLQRTFGGWYPEPGQLERCATPYFELIEEEEGTEDYRRTSEYWLKRLRWSAALDPRVWWTLGRKWWKSPSAVAEMLRCQIWDQSWAWQFRPPAPTRLLRQTWLAK